MIIKILLVVFIVIIIYGLIVLLGSILDTDTDNADYLIVLGHKLNNDKPTNVLKYRLRKTLNYIDNNKDTKIILSGGKTHNNTLTEANVMKEYLLKNGVSENNIILEDKSVDTVENIKNCKSYIDNNSKIVILSSNYHILRARMICKLLGLNVKGIGTYTPIISLLKHLMIEEIFIIVNYVRIKNKEDIN